MKCLTGRVINTWVPSCLHAETRVSWADCGVERVKTFMAVQDTGGGETLTYEMSQFLQWLRSSHCPHHEGLQSRGWFPSIFFHGFKRNLGIVKPVMRRELLTVENKEVLSDIRSWRVILICCHLKPRGVYSTCSGESLGLRSGSESGLGLGLGLLGDLLNGLC